MYILFLYWINFYIFNRRYRNIIYITSLTILYFISYKSKLSLVLKFTAISLLASKLLQLKSWIIHNEKRVQLFYWWLQIQLSLIRVIHFWHVVYFLSLLKVLIIIISCLYRLIITVKAKYNKKRCVFRRR